MKRHEANVALREALAKKQREYREAAGRREGSRELHEAAILVGCLRRLTEHSTPDELHYAFGAPGDFGYDTPLGAALYALYSSKPDGAAGEGLEVAEVRS